MNRGDLAIKALFQEDLRPDLLYYFDRYQEVKRNWVFENGVWVLKEDSFIEQWSQALKEEVVTQDFNKCLGSGGALWGAFDGGRCIGFATLMGQPFGSGNQYLQLMQVHISCGYRGLGLGSILFQQSAAKAKAMGAEKLYISAFTAEETQRFYDKMGCVDAAEINGEILSFDPGRQMEYILSQE